jgi:hypothetical protein
MTEKIEYKGYTIEIGLDEFNESPREWDNLGIMVCFHNRYNLGDEKTEYYQDDSLAFQDWLQVNEKDLIYLPLYLYDHSGITMNTIGFPCPWDSGQVGYIYVSIEDVKKEWEWKRLTRQRRGFIENILEGEVETYDQYLRGEVYYYVVLDKENNPVDSCCGFYNKDHAISQAEDWINYEYKNTYHQLELIPA